MVGLTQFLFGLLLALVGNLVVWTIIAAQALYSYKTTKMKMFYLRSNFQLGILAGLILRNTLAYMP